MNHRLKAALIFVAASALYFVTRTPALDEHDSIQFALGVLDFNVWKDQPHAPGYPLFIFLGWLAQKCFGPGPDLSLHLLSAIGGGLFVAIWFLIIRQQLGERLAGWVVICLTITPALWMTATKALTDSLACAFLAAELFSALPQLDRLNRASWRRSVVTGLCGAAACGVRPQLFPVALMILLWGNRAQMKMSILSLGALVSGCLLWLGPMNYTQWRLHPEMPFWSVFPNLAWHQWSWRLDKPGVYLGAGDWSLRYLGTRIAFHFFSWFALGFGFMKSIALIAIGSAIVIAALVSYFSRAAKHDKKFWRYHAPWAIAHVAIIFVTLSPAQRYYLPIFPLLLVMLVRGLGRAAPILPLFLFCVGAPLAMKNHREKPPALRLVEFVRRLYPAPRRHEVVLLFNKVRRHAEWYAPGFDIVHDLSPAELNQIGAGASAIYTDDGKAPLPNGWRRIPLVIFMRSGIIYWKHHTVELYLIERNGD